MSSTILKYAYMVGDNIIAKSTSFDDNEAANIRSLTKGDIVMINNKPRKVLCKRYNPKYPNSLDIVLEETKIHRR